MGTALVTGATSGLGREFCWQLAESGHNLVIVARDEEKLDLLATQLRQVAAIDVEVIAADLAIPEQLARVCVRLEGGTGLKPIGLLVNNAGFALGKPFLDDDLDHELYGLEVMVRAVMATCYYAGNAMRQRGRGSIINVSSVAAETGMGSYSAHKAWVRSFSEGLSEELRGTGVSVTALTPGLVRTEFHENTGIQVDSVPGFAWGDPQKVVEEALAAARRGDVVYTPTTFYKVVNSVSRLAPRSVVRAVSRRLPHA